MVGIVQISPVVSGNALLPQLVYDDLIAAGYVVPEFEPDASEQYVFNEADAGVLRSRVGGGTLTPVGTAPTIGANKITIAAGMYGLSFDTPIATAITFAIVFKRPASVSSALALIGNDAGPVTNTGAGLYLSSTGGYTLSIRPGSDDPAIIGAVGNPAVPVGSWGFVAGSLDATSNTIFLGSASGTHYTHSPAIVTRTLGGTIGLGKIVDMSTGFDNAELDVFSAVVLPRKLSVAELGQLYKRSAVVASRAGITLV